MQKESIKVLQKGYLMNYYFLNMEKSLGLSAVNEIQVFDLR
jgi:hypothetical protein